MIYVFIFLLGLTTGSFLNVCIHRIPKGEPVTFPASHCSCCGTKLKVVDLVPLAGFIVRRGRFRCCGGRIPVQNPVVEFLYGVLFLLLFYRFSLSFLFLKHAIITAVLLAIAVIDLRTEEIPDGLLVSGLLAAVFLITADRAVTVKSALAGSTAGFGIFLVIALASNAMGGGDVKLMALVGLAAGWKRVLLIIFLSFMISAFVSLFLMVFKIKGRKEFIPFAPFIFIAFLVAVLWGDSIIALY